MSDEWDAIRDLDEKELWIERTAVLSRDDHLNFMQYAKEILDTVIDELPIEAQADELGFTDEDFQSSAAQFDVDYLERISAENAGTSELGRQSLYVKFDPLVGNNSPKVPQTQQMPSDDLLMLDTPPPAAIKSCMKSGATAKKHVQIATTDTLPVSPSIPTETSMDATVTSGERITELDSGLLGTKASEEATDYKEEQVTKEPSEGTLIQVLQYTEDDLTRMKTEAIIECRERVKRRKEAEINELREKIAAAKKTVKKNQKREGSFKSSLVVHDALVQKLEAEIQQYKDRVNAHVERENEVLENHKKLLKDAALVEERQAAIKEDTNKLEDLYEEAQKRFLGIKPVHKKLTQQYKMMTARRAEVLKANADNSSLVDRTREDNKRLSAEIKATLEDTRKENIAKVGLVRANQEKFLVDIEGLKSDIELLDQENKQLSSMCEELRGAM